MTLYETKNYGVVRSSSVWQYCAHCSNISSITSFRLKVSYFNELTAKTAHSLCVYIPKIYHFFVFDCSLIRWVAAHAAIAKERTCTISKMGFLMFSRGCSKFLIYNDYLTQKSVDVNGIGWHEVWKLLRERLFMYWCIEDMLSELLKN